METDKSKAWDLFFTDASRPLICAFNFPAVALVLGRNRWEKDLRPTYMSLTCETSPAIRKTLAASLGELATIIGPENAEKDLLPVWFSSLGCQEEEVRMKLLDCLLSLTAAVGNKARIKILDGLLEIWRHGGWREREMVAQSLKPLFLLMAEKGDVRESSECIRGLLRAALWDNVNAVREAGIGVLPLIWMTFQEREMSLEGLRGDLNALARADTFRRRMTFIACQQALVIPGTDNRAAISPDPDFWTTLITLSEDSVQGVRIGVARLVGLLTQHLIARRELLPDTLTQLSRRLSKDDAKEVQSYVIYPSPGAEASAHGVNPTTSPSASAIFSRPPIQFQTKNSTAALGKP